MPPNRLIVIVSITTAATVSLLTLLANILDYSSEADAGVALSSVGSTTLTAMLVLALSIGLLLLSFEEKSLKARAVSGLVILITSYLFLVALGALPAIPDGAASTREGLAIGSLISLNGLLAIFMLSTSLLILSYPDLTGLQNSMALVCALLALSISLLAVFGYAVGIEFAYWWPSSRKLGPFTSGGLLALSVGFIAMSWHRFSAPARKSTDVLAGIQVASGSILFVTVLLCGSLALIPFYESLLQKVYDEAKSSVEAKRVESSLFFSSIQLIADSLSVSAGNQDLDRAVARAGPFPGIRELNFTPQAGASVGSAQQNEFSPARAVPKLIVEPFGNDSGRLMVEAPVYNPLRERIGTLTALIDLGYLSNLLSDHIPFSAHQGSFYLLTDSRTQDTRLLKVTVANRAVEFIVVEKAPAELLRALSPDTMQELSPSQAILSRDMVSFLSPLRGLRAYLGFVSKVTPFRNLFHERLINVIGGVLMLLLAGTGFIYFLMRKLGLQMISLEGKVRQSLEAVAEELKLRQKAQLEIEQSLEEKEVLLKEIHHRVKNNLQVISSILSLQLRRTEGPEAAAILRDSADRIQSIALLHETLYRSSSFNSIDLRDYITQLSRHLNQSYNSYSGLKTEINTQGITLEIDRAIPLGLILTELITNSLKYAFGPADNVARLPRITIDCSILPTGKFCLDYRDSGKGLPEGFSLDSPQSLGTRLVSILVRQLKGELVYSSENGARFQLTFVYSNNHKELENEKTANSDC